MEGGGLDIIMVIIMIIIIIIIIAVQVLCNWIYGGGLDWRGLDWIR